MRDGWHEVFQVGLQQHLVFCSCGLYFFCDQRDICATYASARALSLQHIRSQETLDFSYVVKRVSFKRLKRLVAGGSVCDVVPVKPSRTFSRNFDESANQHHIRCRCDPAIQILRFRRLHDDKVAIV